MSIVSDDLPNRGYLRSGAERAIWMSGEPLEFADITDTILRRQALEIMGEHED